MTDSSIMRILVLLFLTTATVQSVNTCTYTGGTATVDGGTGATLCETNQEDCSACGTGYTISNPATMGSAQTCVANTCNVDDPMQICGVGTTWLETECVLSDIVTVQPSRTYVKNKYNEFCNAGSLCNADSPVHVCGEGTTWHITECVAESVAAAAPVAKTASYIVPLSIGGGVLAVIIISILIYIFACKNIDETPQNQITQHMLRPRTKLDF